MGEPVFDDRLRRARDDAYQAIAELLALVNDAGLAEDLPTDPVDWVVSVRARAAMVAMAATQRGPAPAPLDRTIRSVAGMARRLIEDGMSLEEQAIDMGHPDFRNAHQGRALGMQLSGTRLWEICHSHPDLPILDPTPAAVA